jgi:excisionase family DNA binding protein
MSPQESHDYSRPINRVRNTTADYAHPPSVAPQRLLLTLPEVCIVLSLGRSSVNALVWAGEIPSIRIGRSRRVALGDLESWIEIRKARDTQ